MAKQKKIYSPKEINDLRKVWYEKLAKKGFEDLELVYEDGNSSHFLRKNLRLRASCDAEAIASTREYYSIAAEFAHHGDFPSFVESRIWQLHADGWTYRKIAKRMNLGVSTIHRKINHMEKLMWDWWSDPNHERFANE